MKLSRYLLLAMAALGLIGGFILPNAAAGIMDARRLDNLVIIDALSISFSADPELGMLERIALASSPKTEVLALTTGQKMEMETAEARVTQELERFFSNGSLEFLIIDECVIESASPAFVINSEVPSSNMIIWELKVQDKHSNEVVATIDDATGIILRIIYRRGNGPINSEGFTEEEISSPPSEIMYSATKVITDMMTAYYGLPVGIGDYEFSGNIAYYRADMSSAGTNVPMYGVVRANGFTMNERP